jgi:hypothetical protein
MTLIIVGDEAMTPEEWERRERRRAWEREYRRRRYHDDPDFRQRALDAVKAWRRKQGVQPRPGPRVRVTYTVGSLHDGSCTGPTRSTGCRCQKIRVASLAPQEQAA